MISGTHAEVWEENGKIYVRDLRSANGTYLNGDRLSASRVLSRAFELATDDVVAFGGDILDKETNILHHAIVAKVACILSPEDTRAPQVYARNAEIRLKNTLEEESRLSSTAQTGDSFLASPGDRQVSYQRYRSHTLRSLTDPVTTLPDDFPSFFGPSIIFKPLSDSFGGPKHISLPEHQRIEIGRENTSNPDTVASWSNGYFNQKSVSRQHAEVWEENGKIFIRDVGSSNGTVVNGVRLSAEGTASGPCELKTHDIVEFGTDIVGDDSNAIVHYRVPVMVEYYAENGSSTTSPASPISSPPTAEPVPIPALYRPKIPSWVATGRDATEHDTPHEAHDKQEVFQRFTASENILTFF
ncbi:SMAD/FHA domain-containing protein [Phellopilus nigrolimitatus]|nr:SMAD/FHA domain-containing protein [Phellopilus nigrolimitatus]